MVDAYAHKYPLVVVVLASIMSSSSSSLAPAMHPGFGAILRSRSLERFDPKVLEDGDGMHVIADLPRTGLDSVLRVAAQHVGLKEVYAGKCLVPPPGAHPYIVFFFFGVERSHVDSRNTNIYTFRLRRTPQCAQKMRRICPHNFHPRTRGWSPDTGVRVGLQPSDGRAAHRISRYDVGYTILLGSLSRLLFLSF